MEFVVADVPGLVEGAASGRGLGHRFLRHVERSRVLLLLVDLTAPEGRSSDHQERVLLDELGRYQPELLDRPRLVVGSKADLAAISPAVGSTAGKNLEPETLRISAVTGEGLPQLVARLAAMVASTRQADEARSVSGGGGSALVHRPLPEGVEVIRGDDGSFVVQGRPALRAVALNDLTGEDAMEYVQDRIRRLGVERALVRAGIRDGDLVHLGPLTFTYHRDELGLDVAGAARSSESGQGDDRPGFRGKRKSSRRT
jgi:GTP-binding protein